MEVAEQNQGLKNGVLISPGFRARFWQPVDIASLVFFRIAFGVIMICEVIRGFWGDRLAQYYIDPQFLFTYYGFGWVHPWPGNGMYYHFALLGVLSVMVLCGLFYRISTALFFIAFTYVFLLDQAQYLNHIYLVCLISFLMIFIPAHRSVSLDARWGFTNRSNTAPAWTLWLLRAQLGIVYFFAGVAKLNSDWLLRGEPVRMWLAGRTGLPLAGSMMGKEWTVWFFVYGGLLFDLFITPALLWKRTRAMAFAAAVLFHLTNAVVFAIGIFPWFMIAATTLFFSPDWPRRLVKAKSVPLQRSNGTGERRVPSSAVQSATVALLGIYLIWQILMPLRHLLYPGDVHWTEEGHRFSWRMKLRDKRGDSQFTVRDPATGQTEVVNPSEYLTRRQVSEMPVRPDMVLQFAHFVAGEKRRAGLTNAEVRALVQVSLNGRHGQLMIDPKVNLAAEARTLRAASWILPLREEVGPRVKTPR